MNFEQTEINFNIKFTGGRKVKYLTVNRIGYGYEFVPHELIKYCALQDYSIKEIHFSGKLGGFWLLAEKTQK